MLVLVTLCWFAAPLVDASACDGAPCSAGGDAAAVCTNRAAPEEGAECACSSSPFVGPLCGRVCDVGSLGTGLSNSRTGLLVGPSLLATRVGSSGNKTLRYYDSVVGTTLTVPAQGSITTVTAVMNPYLTLSQIIARLWGPSQKFADAAAGCALSWNISAPDTDTPLLASSSGGVLGERVASGPTKNKVTFTFPGAVNVEAGSTVFVTFEIKDAKARFDAQQASGSKTPLTLNMYTTGSWTDEQARVAKQSGAGVTFLINAAAGVVVRKVSYFAQHMVSFRCDDDSASPVPIVLNTAWGCNIDGQCGRGCGGPGPVPTPPPAPRASPFPIVLVLCIVGGVLVTLFVLHRRCNTPMQSGDAGAAVQMSTTNSGPSLQDVHGDTNVQNVL